MIDKKNGVEIGGVLEKYLRGKLIIKDDNVSMSVKVSNNNSKLVGYNNSNNDKSS